MLFRVVAANDRWLLHQTLVLLIVATMGRTKWRYVAATLVSPERHTILSSLVFGATLTTKAAVSSNYRCEVGVVFFHSESTSILAVDT